MRLVAEAFEVADEDTKNKIGDCLYDDQGARWASVWSLLDELPDGVQALREHMAREEQEHRREVRLPSVESRPYPRSVGVQVESRDVVCDDLNGVRVVRT